MKLTMEQIWQWHKDALRGLPKFTQEKGSYIQVREDLNQKIIALTTELIDKRMKE